LHNRRQKLARQGVPSQNYRKKRGNVRGVHSTQSGKAGQSARAWGSKFHVKGIWKAGWEGEGQGLQCCLVRCRTHNTALAIWGPAGRGRGVEGMMTHGFLSIGDGDGAATLLGFLTERAGKKKGFFKFTWGKKAMARKGKNEALLVKIRLQKWGGGGGGLEEGG